MLIETLLFLGFLYYAYQTYHHYAERRTYWSKKGITSPPDEFFFGHIRKMWDFSYPRSLVYRDWTKKYGKVYGIFDGAKPIMITSNLEMMNEVLVRQFDKFYARMRFPIQSKKENPKTHIVEARGPQWKRLRALGSIAFTNKSLKHIRNTVEESAIIACNEMERRSKEGEVNMALFYQEFSLDVICKVALGQKDVIMFNNPYLEIVRSLFRRPASHPLMAIPSLFPGVVDVWRFLLERMASKTPVARLLKSLTEQIEKKKKERDQGVTSTTDFIDIFLDAEVEESELTFGEQTFGEYRNVSRKMHPDEIVQQSFIFLLAGFDTTATSLSFATHFLANHPEIQERVREEVDAVCPDESIEYDSMAELKYTECVIKESLRHFPLSSLVVSRECAEDTEVCGYKIRKGDNIQLDSWSMHMDKEIWGEDAEEFRPERWLEESPKNRVAFQSFGGGPRMCIGMRLAYMEEKMLLAHIMKRFIIEKTPNTNPLKLVGAFTVSPETVMVQLRRR